MVGISRTDNILLLGRAQLQELRRKKVQADDKSTNTDVFFQSKADPTMLRDLEFAEGAEKRDAFQKVFLKSMLADRFGSDLINDPGFVRIVDKVHEQIKGAPEIEDLMTKTIRDLFDESRST